MFGNVKFIIRFLLLCVLAVPLPVAARESAPVVPLGGARLIDAKPDATTFELITPTYEFETVESQSGPCEIIRVDGYPLNEQPGAPLLPVKPILLGIPAGAELSIQVIPIVKETLPGSYHLCPASDKWVELDENGVSQQMEEESEPDPLIYTLNAPYPAAIGTVEDIGFLRSQRIARVQLSPFQYQPESGAITYFSHLVVSVSYDGAILLDHAGTLGESETFERALQSSLLNYQSSRAWRMQPEAPEEELGWRLPAKAYRLVVEGTGIFQVSRSELEAVGLPASEVNLDRFHLFHNGYEVPIGSSQADGTPNTDSRFDEGDTLYFYAEAIDETYTGQDVFWLSIGEGKGRQFEVRSGQSEGEVSYVVNQTVQVRIEENRSYVSSVVTLPQNDRWFGRLLQTFGTGESVRRSYPLQLSQPISDDGKAMLSLALASVVSRNKGRNHARIYINDVLVHDGEWDGRVYYQSGSYFDSAILKDGNNLVTVELINDREDQTFTGAYLDWIELRYIRRLSAIDDQLQFESPGLGNWRFSLEGFSRSDISIFDVTDPQNPFLIDSDAIEGRVAFSSESIARRRNYVALAPNARLEVSDIQPVATGINLLSTSNQADYIVISHSDFLDEIRPLVEYRERQGLTVLLVDVQQIYDQFSFGRMSARAIRDFLSYAYHHWRDPSPSYALLVGDGTYDPRGYLPDSNPTFIPPFLADVDPDLGETAADNRFVTVSGQDLLPDIHLGRFPVNTREEARVMVEKTIAYEMTPRSDWHNKILFVTDDLSNGGGSFYNFSDAAAEGLIERTNQPFVPETYEKQKIYLGKNCSDGECQQQLREGIQEGALFISYVGHSSKQSWAAEELLSTSNIQMLQNDERLPIMLPMTCLEGYFHQADRDTLAENLLRMSSGGSVASWSATGLGLVTGHDYLEKGFLLGVFHEDIDTIGAAATRGKLYLLENAPSERYEDLLDTYLVLGDPALQIQVGDINTPTRPETRLFLPSVGR